MYLQSLKKTLLNFGPQFVILILIGGAVWSTTRGSDSASPSKPKPTVSTPFTFGKDRECDTLNLEPGQKLLDYTVVGDHPNDMHIYFTTRPLRAEEAAVPETVVYRFSTHTYPQTGCAFIIREHTLPAPVVSK